ncbi:MAG: aldehyde ferredoxin oxidoreductase, partial [Bacteroidetes bacterium]|nr:aldehyde ferredoxin oxidoreductase [Bacteroidota bacterium]
FAIQVKGLEVAAYDPRAAWGQGLSYAVANRGGCHLGSYLVGMEILFPYMKPLSLKGKAEWAIFYEDLFAAMNSLQICQFTGYGILAEYPVPKYIPPVLLRPVVAFFPRLSQLLMNWAGLSQLYTGLTGIKMSQKGILRAGERINKLERWMDFRMNPAGMLDELPGRFLNEKETKFQGKNTVVPLDKLLEEYYLLRRYSAIGEVSESDLRRLDVDL